MGEIKLNGMLEKKLGVFKRPSFKSIQSSIAVAFSCLIIAIILVMAFLSYRLNSDSVENNSQEYTYQLIEQVNTNIESYINYMENISSMVLDNYDIREYLSQESELDREKNELQEQKISALFKSIINARKDISSIMIFGYNGKFISNRRNIKLNENNAPKNQSWYKKAVEAGGRAVVSSSHVQNVIEDEYRWVVSLSRELTSADGKNKLGVINVDLNYSVINNMCNKIKLGKKGYIFIVDNEGNIVYHPQQQLVYSNIKTEQIDRVLKSTSSSFILNEGGQKKMYTIKELSQTGWKIVGVAYVDELVANKRTIQAYYLLGGIGFLVLTIILSIVISSRISKPVKRLEASMKEVEKGNFNIQVDIASSNEIGELSRAFNIMTSEIKELIKQNMKEQELKRKSELKALQAQINPHFLYNTLDSIIWMAESKKSEEVILMASALAKLFRLSLSKGEEIITIGTEIEHIKSYLTIQQMRYRNKLDFEIDVDEDIRQNKILKIILQPLVENAIYHGIKNKAEVGTVKIKGKRDGDRILLQVIDNGAGMTPEEIETIFNKKESSVRGSGVGVRNVNERIKLYFGDDYGLSFESEIDRGTVANLRLPVME
ncbi:MAG: sensor histidine kinase [Clostridia bacterium]|nr:sensor histidine kinase [Clostridia bacterium]